MKKKLPTLNCIIIEDDKTSKNIIEELINKTDSLNLLNSFERAIDAIKALNNEEIHLIFLDIELPDMNGLDFLKSVKNLPQIIITTAFERYALEAFEYNVTDYLIKPISKSRFSKAVDKALNNFNQCRDIASNVSTEIFIKKDLTTLVRLKYDDILWIEALAYRVVFYTETEKYVIYFSMKSVIKKLPASKFKRVHRSYIVNINKIKFIKDNSIVIDKKGRKKAIPIGKLYKDNFIAEINIIEK